MGGKEHVSKLPVPTPKTYPDCVLADSEWHQNFHSSRGIRVITFDIAVLYKLRTLIHQ